MGTTLDNKLKQLSPERRKRIEDAAAREAAIYLTLQELRQSRDMTQVELAKKLGITQETLSRMERRDDLLLSSIRNLVEEMGGRLNLIVEFPDHEPVILNGLGDRDEEARV